MADKSSFTKDEWTLLLESPMIAGMAITAADPSGLWGLLKESFASGNALAKAMVDPSSNSLVKALVTDFSTSEARSAARDSLKDQARQQQTCRGQNEVYRSSTSGFGDLGDKGTGRRCSLQKLASSD
jgi:hypothetical protein